MLKMSLAIKKWLRFLATMYFGQEVETLQTEIAATTVYSLNVLQPMK